MAQLNRDRPDPRVEVRIVVTTINLAIVGGGPKAAALCAKIACLRELYKVPIDAVVFEKSSLGAHWSGGGSGYTDGVQSLCTPAERDLGFPYSDAFGDTDRIANKMLADYSWPAHLIRNGDYARWVGNGRHRPSHGAFADYVASAIKRSGATIQDGEVFALRRRDQAWIVSYRNDDGEDSLPDFNGVVITGSGPPRPAMGNALRSRWIFDGQSFWRNRTLIRDHLNSIDADASEEDVVIIGAGGTAAAIAGWLVRQGVTRPIRIIGSQPTLYARADSAFENRMFENLEVWNTLSYERRKEFSERLTRGAVWQTVIEDLGRAENIDYTPGEAKAVELENPLDKEGPLQVLYADSATGDDAPPASAAIVIDARGFDGWWFRQWLTQGLSDRIETERTVMEQEMGDDLSLPLGGAAPNLHVPGKSWFKHPGYASLMTLGDMADAILRPYVEPYLDARAPIPPVVSTS